MFCKPPSMWIPSRKTDVSLCPCGIFSYLFIILFIDLLLFIQQDAFLQIFKFVLEARLFFMTIPVPSSSHPTLPPTPT